MNALIDVEQKIELYKNVIDISKKNQTLNSLGKFKKELEKLESNQLELEKHLVIYNKDVTPVLLKVDNFRTGLIMELQQVSGLLKLSASAKKNRKLAKKFDFFSKDFNEVKDKQLLKQAQKALLFANDLAGYSITSISDLTPKAFNKKSERAQELSDDFGLTAEKIKQLEETSIAFLKSIVEVDAATKEKKKTLKVIKKLFDRNDSSLNKKLDKFVSIYEKPGSSFLKTYTNLRAKNEHEQKILESAQKV